MDEVVTITELERARESFDAARRLLDAALVDRVSHSVRGRVGELCADGSDGVSHQLLPAVRELIAEQDRVERVVKRELAPILAGTAVPDLDAPLQEGESDEPFLAAGTQQRLRLAFKLLFFVLRSLQDALNVCCFALVTGSRPSKRASTIQYALNHPQSPVGTVITAHLPGYAAWFADWRHQRNRVKDGTGFGTFCVDGEIGIHFTTLTDSNVLVVDLAETRVGLRDIARALDETRRFMEIVRKIAAAPPAP